MPVDGWVPMFVVPLLALAGLASGAVSRSGAICGTALGWILSYGLGWSGLAMPSALALLGTLVSARKHNRRNALQVFCNGGVAAIAALAAACGWRLGALVAASALSAALSDTAAGEIGRRFSATPRRLLVGPPVERGRDGAMSWMGTGAGAAFAFPIPLVAWALGALPDFAAVGAVAAAGFAGNVVDSILGASTQRRLGARGNDWVNLMMTTAAAALAVLAVLCRPG